MQLPHRHAISCRRLLHFFLPLCSSPFECLQWSGRCWSIEEHRMWSHHLSNAILEEFQETSLPQHTKKDCEKLWHSLSSTFTPTKPQHFANGGPCKSAFKTPLEVLYDFTARFDKFAQLLGLWTWTLSKALTPRLQGLTVSSVFS